MSLGIIGKKLGMTRVFDEKTGTMTPVTVVAVAGNEFLQIKKQEEEGYSAVQVGFDDQKEQRMSKAEKGHLKKYGKSIKRHIVEFRFDNDEGLPQKEDKHSGVELFEVGQQVDVIGTTKSKGFQGVVKRYGFGGSPASHGSMMHRRTGAVGAGSTPARIWKGQKMPGRDGGGQRTAQNLKIVQVRSEDNLILVSGAVPGYNSSYVVIRPAKKATVK